ncbi:MAG: hypothetical protein IJ480_05055 [Clostridia bacterium]|nr:hypothetical protein [Clostridia bacterium]
MKRTISILLLAAMLTGTLFSCGGGSDETESADGTADLTDTETVQETEETSYIDALPAADYAGATFTVHGANSLNGHEYATTLQFSCGETTGEPANDILFERTAYLENYYNVKFEEIIEPGNIDPNKVIANIQAGDAACDMFFCDIAWQGYTIVIKGSVYPVDMVKGIQIDKPYWASEITESLTIADSFYFPAGPISPRYYGSAYVLMFNRDIVEDMNLEDPYTLVSEGTWTIDKMMGMALQGYVDLDGNGTLDVSDQMGLGYEVLTPESFLMGCGYHYVENVDGTLQCTLDNENLITRIQWLRDQMMKEGIFWEGRSEFDYDIMLENGRLLFANPCTFVLPVFREYEYDFGILPMPKDNEMQENYISYAQPWVVSVPYVPVTNVGETLDMTGILIDAMAAYGYEKVRPVIYEDVISLKNTRDEASARIVDMIFDTITIDAAVCVGLDGFYSELQQFFCHKLGQQEITSLYATHKASVESFFVKLEEQFREMRASLESSK